MRDASVDRQRSSGAIFFLRTFGAVSLIRSDGTTILGTHGSHRRRLALLAVLAATGERGCSRDQLMLLFWPEATQGRAQHSLDQLLYALRASISDEMFNSSNPVRLDASIVASDVGDFTAALARNDLEHAVAQYSGPFLDGFYPADVPEFERWADAERGRLVALYAGALGALAKRATEDGDHERAVQWWTALSATDPLSTKYAIGHIRAVAAAGDRAAALQHAKRYEALVTQELGLSVDPAVSAVIEEIRNARSRAAPDPSHENVRASAPQSTAFDASRPVRGQPRALVIAVIVIVLLATGILARSTRQRANTRGAAELSTGAFPLANVSRAPTQDIAAHEWYVRGSDPTLMRSDSGALAALEDFQKAIALDSNYAQAYAGLAQALMRTSNVVAERGEDRRQRLILAEQAAVRAVQLDDSLSDAHAALGFVHRNNYELAAAIREMVHASTLDPGNARLHEWLVQLYVIAGRPVDALAEARRAVALDPLSPTANAELARALFSSSRCDEALAQLAKLQHLRPPLLRALSIAAQCYARKGMWPEAIAASRRTRVGQRRGNGLLGFLLARGARLTEARFLLDTLRAEAYAGREDSYEIGALYAGLDKKDSAFIWLNRGIDDRSLDFEYLNTILDALSPDARLHALRQRIGIED